MQSAVLLARREGQRTHLQIQVSTHNQVVTEEGRVNQIVLETNNRIRTFEPVQTSCWNLASQFNSYLLRGGPTWGGGAVVSGATISWYLCWEKWPRAGVQGCQPTRISSVPESEEQ